MLHGDERAIGPYEVLERLGSGGMGEVFKANDPRLNRLVAIKTLKRPQGSATQRFQREAQLAAKLNHPGIVQVYDVLRANGRDHIVMEYVPGQTLREVLSEGLVPLGRALDLARQISAALYQAHRNGIIHRDLKAENILVNREGHIKITDFGIAKPVLPADEQDPLTQSRAIIGTCYAMSPEQAQGRKVDYRSDLFSLGTLLYEMFAGFSPFKSKEQVDTLHRIVYHCQEPIWKHRPDMPRALSDLVDHLLQKRPELRPQHAHAVAEALHEIKLEEEEDTEATIDVSSSGEAAKASSGSAKASRFPIAMAILVTILIGVGSVIWFLATRRVAPEPLYVVVEKPVLENGNDKLALVSLTAELAINRALLSLENVFPLDASDLRNTGGTVKEMALAAAADELIRFEIDCEANDCRLILRRFRGADGGLLWLKELAVPKRDKMLFSRAVASQIDQAYPDRRKWRGDEPRDFTDEDDYVTYLSLFQSFQNETQPLETLAQGLAEIRGRSPRFSEAYLLESKIAFFLFNDRRDPAMLAHGLELTDQAKSISSEEPLTHVRAFDLAMAGGMLDRAEDELEALQRMRPEGTLGLKLAGRLAERRGDIDRALSASREVVSRHPSVPNLYLAANLHFRQGAYAEARAFYQSLLRKDSGYVRARRMLANLELLHGDLREAVRLLTQLLESKPSLGTLTNLGVAHMLLGELTEAVSFFNRAEEMAPRNPVVKLNRADALWLSGEQEAARRAYAEILAFLEEEPGNTDFLGTKAQALAHLGRNLEAVEAIQAALRSAPQNPEVAYAAALVHALVGDRTAALAHAKRASADGLESRWFSFPWFDGIRDDLERQEGMGQIAVD